MAIELSGGKWRRLRSLADEQGRFKMMAIDQRGSLRQAIARATGREPEQITHEDMARAKAVVTRILAPYATAVLTDPIFGYPTSFEHLPPGVGLLLAYEETGYERGGHDGKERKSQLMDGWSVEKFQHAGADAVKLLIYYRPDGSPEVRLHQQEIVRRVGEECERANMPFLLELLSYALDERSTDTAEYARKKPELVISGAVEFSDPRYKVDILKLEFPADLKWVKEFAGGAFDSKERQPVGTIAEARGFCHQLGDAAGKPWVILSAGVGIQEFLVQVELATEAGASGFLCGRAIWQDAISLYPDVAKMEQWLGTQGGYNFVRANAYAQRAVPWFHHRNLASPKPF